MNDRQHEVYARITSHIVEAMEKEPGKLRMPWHTDAAEAIMPVNVHSEQPYRGANILSLWASAELKGYQSGLWGTYRQWRELGASVRSGERGTPIFHWQVKDKEIQEGEQQEHDARRQVIVRAYTVFNVAQVEGFIPKAMPNLSEAQRIAAAERFYKGVGVSIREGGAVPCYEPQTDQVHMPPFKVFDSPHDYYSILAHETTHWTGAKTRLARDLNNRFGSNAYAAEELVAELGAAFQMGHLGLSTKPRRDHAAYISNWITLLRDDPKAIVTAAGKAQEAVDWLGREYEKRQKAEEEKDKSAATKTARQEHQESTAVPPREGTPVEPVLEPERGEHPLASYAHLGPKEKVTSCLTDMLTWCKRHGVLFDECLVEARREYHRESLTSLEVDKTPLCEVWHTKNPKAKNQRFPDDFEHVASVKTSSMWHAYQSTIHRGAVSWWHNPNVICVKEARSTCLGDVVVSPSREVHLIGPEKQRESVKEQFEQAKQYVKQLDKSR